jgi:serine protease Do
LRRVNGLASLSSQNAAMHHFIVVLVLALATALGGCAAGLAKPRETTARQAVPVSFAGALARGLPAAVGVYGIGQNDARSSSHPEPGVSPAPLRSADRGDLPPWSDFDVRSRVGAGVFISADGLIATAAHVVADAARIIVKLTDERVFTADLVAVDDDADIALLKVAATLPEPPPLGNSASLRPGDWVLAVGEPYGLDRSVVAGIVGGRDRHFAEDGAVLFIQSDLSLNPGNSGGPLLLYMSVLQSAARASLCHGVQSTPAPMLNVVLSRSSGLAALTAPCSTMPRAVTNHVTLAL